MGLRFLLITSGKARILQIALAEKINGPLDWHFIETYAGCFSRRPGKITFHKAPVQLFNIIPQGTFFSSIPAGYHFMLWNSMIDEPCNFSLASKTAHSLLFIFI